MVDRKTQVGIIGVGQIGLKHLETYLTIPDVQITAIAGRDPSRTERIAQKYNIPFWTTNYHALLDLQSVDAVSVCLHNNLHKPVTVSALQAGKHVFCEKPMAGSYLDAAEMLEAARRTGMKLSVQLSSLFEKETKAARVVIEEGWLGKPYYAVSSGFRRRGRPFVDGYGTSAFVQKNQAAGGALYDVGVYHIAAMLYLLDNPKVLRISGRTYQETPMDLGRQKSSGYDVEEFGLGLVHLENGITLQINEAWAIHLDQIGGSYLVGSAGGIRLKPFGIYRSLGDLDLNISTDLDAFDYRLHNVRQLGTAYDGPQQHWIAALQEKISLLPTADLALNTMLISEGIYLSDRLGREVTAEEVIASSVSSAVDI